MAVRSTRRARLERLTTASEGRKPSHPIDLDSSPSYSPPPTSKKRKTKRDTEETVTSNLPCQRCLRNLVPGGDMLSCVCVSGTACVRCRSLKKAAADCIPCPPEQEALARQALYAVSSSTDDWRGLVKVLDTAMKRKHPASSPPVPVMESPVDTTEVDQGTESDSTTQEAEPQRGQAGVKQQFFNAPQLSPPLNQTLRARQDLREFQPSYLGSQGHRLSLPAYNRTLLDSHLSLETILEDLQRTRYGVHRLLMRLERIESLLAQIWYGD